MLGEHKIVAWMQGRMEFGPRALGNRSILASPLDPYSTENLNIFIKHREPFRKFAASVPAELASRIFRSRPERAAPGDGRPREAAQHRKTFESAILGEDLVRVHTVSEADNPLYHRLLPRSRKGHRAAGAVQHQLQPVRRSAGIHAARSGAEFLLIRHRRTVRGKFSGRKMKKLTREQQLEKMRQDWDARARENARHYVNTERTDWTDDAFFASGQQQIDEDMLTDMQNICQGKEPRDMRVLEIGCGAGRVTRALANLFGEVHGVDVSGEMIRQAKIALRDRPNAFVYQNNGKDLTVVPELEFDFAFSSIVFQHIPSREIIENYVREVSRLLRPGALFKFQVQGDSTLQTTPEDTWLGVPFSEQQAVDMAFRCGFEPRYRHGAGGQYFWLWFFKK